MLRALTSISSWLRLWSYFPEENRSKSGSFEKWMLYLCSHSQNWCLSLTFWYELTSKLEIVLRPKAGAAYFFCLVRDSHSLPALPSHLTGPISHLVQVLLLLPCFAPGFPGTGVWEEPEGIDICMLKSLLFPSSVLEYRGLWDNSRKLGLKYLTDASCEWL